LGGHDFYNTTTFVMNIQGTPSFGGATAVAQGGATIVVYNEAVSFTGGIPNAPQYNCSTGGGIGFSTATVTIPGSSPGVVTPPGWASI
jgi:methyl coenzyme M reductase beta subunit